jgi:hypothetical protein
MHKTVRLVAGVASALLLTTVMVSCDDDDPLGLDDPEFTATLNAANERPVGASTATGTGFATFEDEGTHFEYTLSVTGLSNIREAHIHGPATVDQNAGVIINLFNMVGTTPSPATVNGVLATGTITDANNANVTVAQLRAMFNAGTAYVNVHTQQFQAGAIRGQVVVDD